LAAFQRGFVAVRAAAQTIVRFTSKERSDVTRQRRQENQFTFIDSPLPAFSRQHGLRVSAPATITLLDNLGSPGDSRAERYTVDEATRTARLTHSYGSTPAVVTEIGGSVQNLPGSRTLVSFGTAGRVEEYDEAGRVMWRIEAAITEWLMSSRCPLEVRSRRT